MDNLRKSFLVKGNSIVGAVGDKYYSNAPIGVIQAFSGQTAPHGYLLCDGTSYKVADYPDLYAVIGNTYGGDTENFNVPDYRETVLVGVGENTTDTIASHDVYGLGEFKDDQLQDHYHNLSRTDKGESNLLFYQNNGEGENWHGALTTTLTGKTATIITTSEDHTGRGGTTTHGKQKGVTYIIKAFHTNEGVDSGVSDVVINYINATKELLKYKDISSTCVFKTDAMGSNGRLPKVYKNYNSIVIQWDNVVIDKVDRTASYGHIKIPKNSNYDYIIQEGNISVVNAGIPKGIARFFASSTIDDDYLYVSITGDMYVGALETGVDTVRGITTFYFIEK